MKNGTRDVNCFIAYPEVKDKAPAVLVIHEIFGLTPWVRSVDDKLAELGYIAISPDLLSGSGPNGGGTDEIVQAKGDVQKAIMNLPPDQITGDLNAAAKYVTGLPSCNGKLVVCGFCWGGAQSFRYATNDKDLKAAYVFYGTPPMLPGSPPKEIDEDALRRIECPVYGFYAGNDNRVDSTIAATVESMKKLGKTYEPVTYEGAGHGFMRAGENPKPGADNKKAHDEAWESLEGASENEFEVMHSIKIRELCARKV